MSINCVLKGTNISLSNGHKVIEKLKVKETKKLPKKARKNVRHAPLPAMSPYE